MEVALSKRWHTREDSGLRLDRELRWWHDDDPVEHPKIIEAFNRGLTPTEDGKFLLRFGSDWCFVEVEDAAYEVRGWDFENDGVRIHLSDATSEMLDGATVSLDADGIVTCRVKGGRARARFSRSAQAQLGDGLSLEDARWVLRAPDGTVRLSFAAD